MQKCVFLHRHVGLRHERHGLHAASPALARAVKRGLPPGIQQIGTLLALVAGASLARVHVNVVGAAVDLRRARAYKVEKPRLKAALQHLRIER